MTIKSYSKNNKLHYEVYVNTFDRFGKRRQKRKRGFTSREAAKRFEREMLNSASEEILEIPTWEDWLEDCIDKMRLELRASTVINYSGRLAKWVTPYWEGLRMDEITKRDVHNLVFKSWKAVKTDYSRRNLFKMVRRIFEMAVENGLIAKNPCNGIKIKVAKRDMLVLTTEESTKLLSEARAIDHPFYAVWLMALFTGCRSGELMALKWQDLDFDRGVIRVSKQWSPRSGFKQTKTFENRVVPMAKTLKPILQEMRLEAKNAEDFVLPRLKQWLNAEQAKVLRSFCVSIGITPVRFHDLRSTFITNLLSMGVPVARVMAIVGHSDIDTTNAYIRKAGIDIMGVTDSLSYEIPSSKEGQVIPLNL